MAALDIELLNVHYGQAHVLRDVKLSVASGSAVSLIGPSGSGKSTLLRTIVGLSKPSAGVVSLDGRLIDYRSAKSLREARSHMAIVFQQYNLFQNMTVLENVTAAPIKVQRRKAHESIADAKEIRTRVGLADKFDKYPDQLSGGQQQRVAIARGLALKPRLLLLDEVTAALDPELVHEVLTAIEQIAANGMTILLVSHEMSFVRNVSDIVVMMDQGAVIEIGTPEVIFDQTKSERTQSFISKIRH